MTWSLLPQFHIVLIATMISERMIFFLQRYYSILQFSQLLALLSIFSWTPCSDPVACRFQKRNGRSFIHGMESLMLCISPVFQTSLFKMDVSSSIEESYCSTVKLIAFTLLNATTVSLVTTTRILWTKYRYNTSLFWLTSKAAMQFQ